jgi:prepilin-type N-terminal cleavage/methylation domain-containing protein
MKSYFERGFTLIEVLVVVSIVGILSAIVIANMSRSSAQGRDADRKADLRILQLAVEAYKQRNGRYPAMGCIPGADLLSGENDCSNYVAGLVPDYINALPRDPRRGSNVGFAYITNTAAGNSGTSYKLMVVNTVESETMATTSPMRSCDVGVTNSICSATPSTNVCSPSNARFQRSYGVWGGFADGADDTAVRSNTSAVICR